MTLQQDQVSGILAIADHHMVGAVRIVSVERGHDPRDYTLVPFGGAGPLHGCALAELLGISRVLIPLAPGVLCADGLLAADLKAEFSRTLPRAGAVDVELAGEVLADLQAQADEWFAREGVRDEDRRSAHLALLHYRGQGSEIAVPWATTRAQTEANFEAAHKALYGFTLPAPIELVTLRVEATGLATSPPQQMLAAGEKVEPFERVEVHFESGTRQVPVVDRAGLGSGAQFVGPMILKQFDSTVLVQPGWRGIVHESASILLTREDVR
jgi:N-methylhydantoinase A